MRILQAVYIYTSCKVSYSPSSSIGAFPSRIYSRLSGQTRSACPMCITSTGSGAWESTVSPSRWPCHSSGTWISIADLHYKSIRYWTTTKPLAAVRRVARTIFDDAWAFVCLKYDIPTANISCVLSWRSCRHSLSVPNFMPHQTLWYTPATHATA
jgi:hypothetical protein